MSYRLDELVDVWREVTKLGGARHPYCLDICFFIQWFEYNLGRSPYVDDLSAEVLKSFQHYLRYELNYKPSSRSSIAYSLEDFLAFLFDNAYLKNNLAGTVTILTIKEETPDHITGCMFRTYA